MALSMNITSLKCPLVASLGDTYSGDPIFDDFLV